MKQSHLSYPRGTFSVIHESEKDPKEEPEKKGNENERWKADGKDIWKNSNTR